MITFYWILATLSQVLSLVFLFMPGPDNLLFSLLFLGWAILMKLEIIRREHE